MSDQTRNTVVRRFITGYSGLLAALTAIAIAAIVTGVVLDDKEKYLSPLLIAAGAALFGASASSLIGELHRENARTEMRDILSHSLSPGITSSESDLGHFREVWHHYFVTGMDGRRIWRYRLFDFRRSFVVGKLHTRIVAKNEQKQNLLYYVEAGCRESRFFVFCGAENREEPVSIEIYPFMGAKQFVATNAGLGIEVTWDDEEAEYPCILSKHALIVDCDKPAGRDGASFTIDVPERDWRTLDDTWQKLYRRKVGNLAKK